VAVPAVGLEVAVVPWPEDEFDVGAKSFSPVQWLRQQFRGVGGCQWLCRL
jgi:hypothetical protein